MKKRRSQERYFNKGTVGLVKRCVEKGTGKEFAVKIVRTSDEEIIENMVNEFNHLKIVRH